MISFAPRPLEIVRFFRASGRCGHLVAELGEQRDCDRADAAGGSGHDLRAALRRDAVLFQRHHRQHRGVAGGADRHGIARGHRGRQAHEPVALHPRLLGIGAEMGLAEPPTVEDHLVAGLPVGMGGFLHRAGEIDPGDHRPAPHHRRLAGERKAVLVVDGGIRDPDVDVAFHQIGFVEIRERDLLAAVGFLDHDCFETRHGKPRCRCRPIVTMCAADRRATQALPAARSGGDSA